MAAKDFYTVMGVSERATADEIKTQYRRLAKEHHPDSNKNDSKSAERFKEISEAYQVLGDAKKRAQYERAWGSIEKIKEEDGVVKGTVIEVVKGGLILDIGLRGFLPAIVLGAHTAHLGLRLVLQQ